MSRSRLQVLLELGAVRRLDGSVAHAKDKTSSHEIYLVDLPEAVEGYVKGENIALEILFEDTHLLVVNKPAGMVVHPAPGASGGTLVNALLHHFGGNLSGIGGEKRPGIVHRIDKDTSGLLVVAKTDAAHQGLAKQFAQHIAQRHYVAVVRGLPDAGNPRLAGLKGVSFEAGGIIRIEGRIARHSSDRKKMAIVPDNGRHAVTRVKVLEQFGPASKPWASLAECRLETGRTHQIRVHLTYAGHGLIGDKVYGGNKLAAKNAPLVLTRFPRQALHAASLGFMHPTTGEKLEFQSELPDDLRDLILTLRG